MLIEDAVKIRDHKALVALAKTSKYTRDFSNEVMFSGEAAYEKGWVRLARASDQRIVGFYCVRHKVRSPATSLYFITVDPDFRDAGLGEGLMADLFDQARRHGSKRIELNVGKDNRAVSFYERLGFERVHGDAIKGTAWAMRREL